MCAAARFGGRARGLAGRSFDTDPDEQENTMSDNAIPRVDFHIHTKYLKCANETMEVEAVVRECERLGVTALAFTDHLNRVEQAEEHTAILEDIRKLDTDVAVYFGAELNFDGCDGAFAYSEAIRDRIGFQFAIGGIHGTYLQEYDLDTLIEIQHRHHLKTCENPLVSVLVHPYWFGRGEFDRNGWPFFESVAVVPERLVRELGQVARDTGTAIEINGTANLVPQLTADQRSAYRDYLAALAAEGPRFSLSSDAHATDRLVGSQWARDMAIEIGLTADRIWMPPCEPIVGKP
jgi:histidinol phosphatase-like PHP family hydrolase